jgi:hypothetical protein
MDDYQDFLVLALLSKSWQRIMLTQGYARICPGAPVVLSRPFESKQAARSAAKYMGNVTEIQVSRKFAADEPNQVVAMVQTLPEPAKSSVVVWEHTFSPVWADIIAADTWMSAFSPAQIGSLVINMTARRNWPQTLKPLPNYTQLRTLTLVGSLFSVNKLIT